MWKSFSAHVYVKVDRFTSNQNNTKLKGHCLIVLVSGYVC